MSEYEGFLRRWSRRKREVAQPSPTQRPDRPASELPVGSVAQETAAASATGAISSDSLVDLAKLPPIDSITAATDIRPFLAPGVPAELTRAALRRAWAADPAIRDFIGLAENQWDFTAPGGVPGFGSLLDGAQIHRMLAGIIGGGEPEGAGYGPPDSRPIPPSDEPETPHSVALVSSDPRDEVEMPPSTVIEQRAKSVVRRNNENAGQSTGQDDEQSPDPRRHGSALPR